MLGVPNRRTHLRKLFDRVADLLIEYLAVRDDDDGVEHLGTVSLQADELVRQPGNRVRLAAARRVLDEVAPSSAIFLRIRQQLMHDVELVKSRPDLRSLLLVRLRILDLDDLRVVLKDIGEAGASE